MFPMLPIRNPPPFSHKVQPGAMAAVALGPYPPQATDQITEVRSVSSCRDFDGWRLGRVPADGQCWFGQVTVHERFDFDCCQLPCLSRSRLHPTK
jgi:hypothetical protein